ncbi:MAG: NADP-dependent malic enzyme [archaeon]
MDIYRESLKFHEKYRGKLEIKGKTRLRTKHDLSLAYTPGVAAVCREIAKNPTAAYRYTIKSNTVAIVTDGSAVLGLGNIGGLAAIPVMEGKAMLFKEFAGIDAFPICFKDYHVDFIEDIKNIAPVFGGINLEDIAAPKCFEVEESLQDIGIPVMHDDQHGTAIVLLAALINACKATKKRMEDLTVVINGAGAAGTAVARLLKCTGINKKICRSVRDILVLDRKGIIWKGREDLKNNRYKQMLAQITNREIRKGNLEDALRGADVFIGVSVGNLLKEGMIRSMNKGPIIFAMANPIPEIMPDRARKAGASVVGTGRSDFPNQINNVLAFPGVFRGALDARATRITDEMKISAAYALANYVKNPSCSRVVPNPLDRGVAKAVARAVTKAAESCGCARRQG